MHCDLLITGGTVVDGTGAPGRPGDVAITEGRIAAVGEVDAQATRTIDASGKVVAPGFIDLHTHYDAQVLWDPLLSISPWHGVTTVIMGNCGFGVAPTRAEHRGLILRTLEKVEGMSLASLEAGCGEDWPFESFPQYLDAVERRGTAINVGAMIGHTPVRLYVMGEDATERAASAEEIARMRAIVREAVAAGAIGFATSKAPTHVGYAGKPVPSRLAEFDEVRSIAAGLADLHRGILQMTAGPGLFLEEFATLARDSGRRVTWTALLAGMMGPGGHRWLLERSAALVRDGVPVTPQVSCRPLTFEFDLAEPFPFESMQAFRELAAGDRAARRRAYADAGFRERVRGTLATGTSGVFSFSWSRVVIASFPPDPSLEERALEAVAHERGMDPSDLMFDLALASDLAARFRMVIVNDDEDEVAELLTHPDTVLGLSDAGAHASQLCDAGFSTHLLGHWVRERGTLGLEEAVRMLTSRVADLVGIPDRGRLAPGLAADLTVFDPDRVACGKLRRVRDLPGRADRLVADAYGVDAVVVNGVVVRQADVDAVDARGPLPGRLLRSRTDG